MVRGLANHPVPVILLTRLAVDRSEQGKGLGKALLKDALVRIAGAAEIVGARAVLVHAIDAAAAQFYRRFDFEPSPVNDLHLMLLMKDLRSLTRE
jgi:predicted N-acetyltransferase YhbS